eukprot:tig00020629_g12424.t1
MVLEPRPNAASRRAPRRAASTPSTIGTSPRPRGLLARPAVVSFDPRPVARTLRRRPPNLRTGRRFQVIGCRGGPPPAHSGSPRHPLSNAEESFGARGSGYDSLDFLRAKGRPDVARAVRDRAARAAVLSLDASARIEPLIVLLLANDVPLASIRSGFRCFPRVLFCDAATIASRIAWLRSRGLWRQCTQTLTLSEENLERKWAALSREIGADGARRGPAALPRFPPCPSQSKRRACRRVFEETIAPTLSVENLLGKLDEVQGALGVPRRELAALAARMPGLLEADVPARAGASFEYRGSLGLSRAEAAAVLRAVPRFLVSDIDACYSPADVALLIRRRPTLHRFSVTKYYSPLAMFLSQQGIHGPALVRVLRLAPELLGHSIESLRPKFEFLYAQHYSARVVISYPTALKCSLERRIRPRLLFLAGRGLRAPLCRALTLRDERFAGEVARCRPKEWAAFLGRHAGGPDGTRGQDG